MWVNYTPLNWVITGEGHFKNIMEYRGTEARRLEYLQCLWEWMIWCYQGAKRTDDVTRRVVLHGTTTPIVANASSACY